MVLENVEGILFFFFLWIISIAFFGHFLLHVKHKGVINVIYTIYISVFNLWVFWFHWWPLSFNAHLFTCAQGRCGALLIIQFFGSAILRYKWKLNNTTSLTFMVLLNLLWLRLAFIDLKKGLASRWCYSDNLFLVINLPVLGRNATNSYLPTGWARFFLCFFILNWLVLLLMMSYCWTIKIRRKENLEFTCISMFYWKEH